MFSGLGLVFIVCIVLIWLFVFRWLLVALNLVIVCGLLCLFAGWLYIDVVAVIGCGLSLGLAVDSW